MDHDHTVLDDMQIKELYELMKTGDITARSKLIESNISLVGHIVKRYLKDKYDIDDLISVGCIGLIKAIDTFDINKGVPLCAYASKCINNEILMYLNKENRYINGIEPDCFIDINEDEKEYFRFDNLVSTDEVVCSNCELNNTRAIIMAALTTLNIMDQYIILRHYGLIDGRIWTQKEIGEIFGVTKSYITKREKKVLCKLRSTKSLQELHECY